MKLKSIPELVGRRDTCRPHACPLNPSTQPHLVGKPPATEKRGFHVSRERKSYRMDMNDRMEPRVLPTHRTPPRHEKYTAKIVELFVPAVVRPDQWSSPSFPFSLGWRLYPHFVGLTICFSYCLSTWPFSAQPPQNRKEGPSKRPFNHVYVLHLLSAFTVCKRVNRVVIFCYLMRE